MLNVADQVTAVERNHMKTLRRLHANKAGNLVALKKMIDVGEQRQVSQSIHVVGKKHLLAVKVRLHGFEALSNVRGSARIDEGDTPVLDIAVQQRHVLAAIREDEVVGQTLVVIQKVVLDGVGLVSQAQNEILVAMVSVILHDIDRKSTRLNSS